jgi:peptidoglycan/xylan/chitin deacetylase (PgdA/CDA1 family)
MNKISVVTTSWDDGHPCDLQLAKLLLSRGLPATFYVPLAGECGKPVLRERALRSFLAQGFEIGAHTMSHPILPGLTQKELSREIGGSKYLLEKQLGREVRMFCYPRGRYDGKVIDSVRRSGFEGARTTQMLSQSLGFNRFEMPTTLQAYPHTPLSYLKNLGKRRDLTGIARYFTKHLECKNWVELGKRLFDDVLERGGLWHLYGHSWELEEQGLWDQLQEMFDYVRLRPGVIYATNGQALELLNGRTSSDREAA